MPVNGTAALDEAFGSRPAILFAQGCETCWMNSAALKRYRFTPETCYPEAYVRLLPDILGDRDFIIPEFKKYMKMMNSRGVSSVKEMGFDRFYNLNYGTAATANKVTIEDENVAIEVAIDRLNASQGTIAKAKAVFANMGADGVFGRSDIAAITKDSVTAAGNLITKLKNADLIEPVSGFGKGKYKFIAPKE